jgi:branched-chain amino acid transport system ATP-binding protein
MSLLNVENMHISYGLSRALFGVSLEAHKGELIALLGRNGVGKSTTMRGIMGLNAPTEGRVIWKGEDITGRSSHKNAQDGIGFVPEDRRIFSDLTVWENLDVAAQKSKNDLVKWDVDRVFNFFPDLKQFRDRKGGLLSGGQQQMLTIGRSLMGNPDLLLLDEPSEGLAPIIVSNMRDKIKELKQEGLSIILAEQNLDFVLSLADRVYLLEKGEVVFTGSSSELRENRDVQNKYLSV